MGRPSKLTEEQWDEIKRRVSAGESRSKLAKEFGVSRPQLSERVSEKVAKIQALAIRKVRADQEFEALPLSDRTACLSQMDQIKGIGTSLIQGANRGTRTFERLQRLAERHMDTMEKSGDLTSLATLAALGRTANEYASTGSAMMAANAKSPQELPPEYAPLHLENLTDEELVVYIALAKKAEG